jgi:hypothetical protein
MFENPFKILQNLLGGGASVPTPQAPNAQPLADLSCSEPGRARVLGLARFLNAGQPDFFPAQLYTGFTLEAVENPKLRYCVSCMAAAPAPMQLLEQATPGDWKLAKELPESELRTWLRALVESGAYRIVDPTPIIEISDAASELLSERLF